MQLAFVIKNHVPYSCKVVLLHQKYGKIVGVFSKNDQAALLTSGSLIWCQVEKQNNVYKVLNIDIESEISSKHLVLMHDIFKLCLYRLPSKVSAPELFDFLLYVRAHVDQFCSQGEKIVMLRLFLMLDLLDSDPKIYQIATSNPLNVVLAETEILTAYVAKAWNNFDQMQKMEKID